VRREIPHFKGELITPDDASYDRVRTVWNAMHDRRPRLIARCVDRDDVIAALAYGRARALPIAVRGGGHSIPGHGVIDGGLVIELGRMNNVKVDPVARRALVAGGALLGDVDRATQLFGLVVPAGVVSHAGVGGLTLGGGVGRLMRRFGLTIDSLLSAEVVTASGQVLRASSDENPDLFWALRGGGGNFGIVTEFEFQLHELSQVTVLRTFHTLAATRDLLLRAHRCMASEAPDELLWTSFVRKGHPEPWMPGHLVGEPGIASVIEWSGDPEMGRKVLEDLRAEIEPAASSIELVAFSRIQQADDVLFGHGVRSYIKASFTQELNDELAHVIVERARLLGSHLTQIELLGLGGAIRRLPVSATAFAHRDARWLVNILATWHDEADDDYEIAWTRGSHAAIAPLATGGSYVNFMGADESAGEWAAYGPTLERLQRVKAIYDPDNVFKINQNIVPALPG
jgi:FAD/FMN-containing dehydrogenase